MEHEVQQQEQTRQKLEELKVGKAHRRQDRTFQGSRNGLRPPIYQIRLSAA